MSEEIEKKAKEIIATEIKVCKEVFRSDMNLPTMIYAELKRQGFIQSLPIRDSDAVVTDADIPTMEEISKPKSVKDLTPIQLFIFNYQPRSNSDVFRRQLINAVNQLLVSHLPKSDAVKEVMEIITTSSGDITAPKYCTKCNGLISGAFSGTVKLCKCVEITKNDLEIAFEAGKALINYDWTIQEFSHTNPEPLMYNDFNEWHALYTEGAESNDKRFGENTNIIDATKITPTPEIR